MNASVLADPTPSLQPPSVLLLGPVTVVNARGLVEPTRRSRLTELASILITHPACDHTTIDACYYPGVRVGDNARNTQISKLRRWLGHTPEGEAWLPHYTADTGYALRPEVTSDWQQWRHHIPAGPADASTVNLEAALALVRGRPFDGVRARHYAWAEHTKQQMISAIAAAAYELAHRQILARDWRAAEATATTGLSVEPGLERLWRMRLLAAHGAGNPTAVHETAARLRHLAASLETGLEPATQELLSTLTAGIRRLGPR